MSTPISIKNITKTYPAIGGGGVVHACHDVSLEIEAGELYFLLGPSGCGKTTLLRMIAGFIEPTSGRILFGSQDVTYVPANRRNTGMVFQSYALWPHMTVAANVGFGLDVRGVGGSEASARIREALTAVRMEEYADRKPGQLSGGQQQRVALARALVIKPDVLLLDEPLSNLDAKLRIELRSEIRRICKSAGITGIYVTHDQREALSMADRIAIMSQGRVVQVGDPKTLYRRPTTRFVAQFLGEANVLTGTRQGGGYRTALGSLPLDDQGREIVQICVRPEAIHLSGQGTGLTARVASATFLGEHTSLELAAGESQVHAIVPPDVRVPEVGENVHLAIRGEDCAVLAD